MTITNDIMLQEFNSDEEAIENNLKPGDFYIIKEYTEPYYLPKGTIKQVIVSNTTNTTNITNTTNMVF